MIVEFWRNLPRSLWTVHSYHPPVLGTYVTDSTLSTSTLTWKRKTIRNVIFLKRSSIAWTADLFNINILIAETHIYADLPLTPAVTLSVATSVICVGTAFFPGTLYDLCVLPKIVHYINTCPVTVPSRAYPYRGIPIPWVAEIIYMEEFIYHNTKDRNIHGLF